MRTFAAAFLIAGLLVQPLLAQPLVNAARETLKIATGPDYPPLTDPNLEGGGWATKLVEIALKDAGYKVDISFLPWKRGYEEALGGNFAGTFPYMKTPEREAINLYSKPVVWIGHGFWVHVSNKQTLKEIMAIKQNTLLCRPIGYASPMEVEEKLKRAEFTSTQPESQSDCMRMLSDERIGLALIDDLVGEFETRQKLGDGVFNQIKRVEPSISKISLHLIVPKNRPDGAKILSAFDSALANIQSSSHFARNQADYMAQISKRK